jgi:AcrR family transcriptional regulator
MPKVNEAYKEEARRRILKAAREAFAENGWDQTSMDDIAQKLGASRGGLYLYFRNKEEIFSAITKEWQEQLDELLRSSFSNRELVDGADILFETVSFSHYLPINFDFIAQATHNPLLGQLLKTYYEAHVATIADFIEEQRAKGRIRPEIEARSVAIRIFALFNGLMINVLLGVDKSEMKREWVRSLGQLIVNC